MLNSHWGRLIFLYLLDWKGEKLERIGFLDEAKGLAPIQLVVRISPKDKVAPLFGVNLIRDFSHSPFQTFSRPAFHARVWHLLSTKVEVWVGSMEFSVSGEWVLLRTLISCQDFGALEQSLFAKNLRPPLILLILVSEMVQIMVAGSLTFNIMELEGIVPVSVNGVGVLGHFRPLGVA